MQEFYRNDKVGIVGGITHIFQLHPTGSKMRIAVGLYDTSVSPEVTIGTSEIDFYGLTHGSSTCRNPEYRDVFFRWNPEVGDIGPHRLEARAASWAGEPDRSDNTARMTFLIEPNDWATEVRGDPWDMTEATSSPPAWYTDDISSMYGWTASAYTDSVSGMFEGTVNRRHLDDNRMYLNLNSEEIDGDSYHYFSLIAKTQQNCDVYLGWKDSNNNTGEEEIGELSSNWGRTPVADLSTEWQGRCITELWLSFRLGGLESMPVRVGWVRLLNGEL